MYTKSTLCFMSCSFGDEANWGYGDKNDERLEQYHGVQKKMDIRLGRMVLGNKRFQAQQKYEARSKHGEVQRQSAKVYQQTAKKNKRSRGFVVGARKIAKQEERVTWKEEKIEQYRNRGDWTDDSLSDVEDEEEEE